LRISGWGDGGDFKLVVFTIGNADLDLAAWAWARDFDLVGDFFFFKSRFVFRNVCNVAQRRSLSVAKHYDCTYGVK
jgi:hypothetical protein